MTISVPATVLASMKAAANALMTDTCTIAVQSDSYGDMGELLQDQYTVVASSVACRVITIGSRFREQVTRTGERETIVDSYRLVCPADTALAVDQRVTLDSDDSVWQVVDLITERTSEIDEQAIIIRVQG